MQRGHLPACFFHNLKVIIQLLLCIFKSTPMHLISNVEYKFTCSCDTNVTYTGMTTRHLGVRVEKHLRSKKDSAIQKHINVCRSCKDNKHLFDNFSILKTYDTQYSTKIQETLLIKKHNPKLNTQLCVF